MLCLEIHQIIHFIYTMLSISTYYPFQKVSNTPFYPSEHIIHFKKFCGGARKTPGQS